MRAKSEGLRKAAIANRKANFCCSSETDVLEQEGIERACTIDGLRSTRGLCMGTGGACLAMESRYVVIRGCELIEQESTCKCAIAVLIDFNVSSYNWRSCLSVAKTFTTSAPVKFVRETLWAGCVSDEVFGSEAC